MTNDLIDLVLPLWRKVRRSARVCAVADFVPVQARFANSEDTAEGVRSFIEKRPPRFTGHQSLPGRIIMGI